MELRLNTSFIGFDGIIGRYDYFTNLICLNMITLFFTLPFKLVYLSHANDFSKIFDICGVFYETSIFLKILFFIGTAIGSYIFISNVIRRLNDINGKVNKNLNVFVSGLFLISFFSIFIPCTPFAFILSILSCIVGIILIFKKGKLTGKYPYDYRKEFNWGAFFGTWIWGLFNKTYVTLWMLILWITPWGMLCSIYWGLKGNELAAKNRDWDSLQAFKKSQERQTFWFVIFSIVILPILYFIIIFAIVAGIVFTSVEEAKNSPDKMSATVNKLESTLNTISSMYFESHTITPDENKFYVSPKDWESYSFKEKIDIINIAASMSASERVKIANENPNKKNKKYFSKSSELRRTKIYSSETDELLGEYVMDEDEYANADFKTYLKASLKAYRFYNVTKEKERKLKNGN